MSVECKFSRRWMQCYPYVWLSYSIEPGKRLAEDAEWKLLIKCEHCGRSVIQKGHQLPLVTGRAIKEFAGLPPEEVRNV